MVRVALITNANMVMHGLYEMLDNTDEVAIVGVVDSVKECKAFASQNKIDVVIIDCASVRSPTVTELEKITNDLKCLIKNVDGCISIAGCGDKARFEFARQLGIRGFCLRTVCRGDLIQAIKTVARGDAYVHADYAKLVQLNGNLTFGNTLGKRQLEILSLIMLGHTNREIAEILHLSPETIKSHVKSILKKLGVKDRTQAVSLVFREMLDATTYQNLHYILQHPDSCLAQPQGNASICD